MGYTHYIHHNTDIPSPIWEKFTQDVKKVVDICKNKGISVILFRCSDEDVCLNGVDETSYEDLIINRRPCPFSFCKTDAMPYDTTVVAVLCLLVHYSPTTEVTSDGDRKDWLAGAAIAAEVLGQDAESINPIPETTY